MKFHIYRGAKLVKILDKHRPCIQCGRNFLAPHGGVQVCSDDCRRIRKNIARAVPKINRTCKYCSVEFTTRQSRGGYQKLFCSVKCKRKYDSKNRKDIKLRQITRLDSWKRRYQRPCEICGFTRIINRCHIVPIRLGGTHEDWNIVVLCPNHHWLFDHSKLLPEEFSKIEQKVLYSRVKLGVS